MLGVPSSCMTCLIHPSTCKFLIKHHAMQHDARDAMRRVLIPNSTQTCKARFPQNLPTRYIAQMASSISHLPPLSMRRVVGATTLPLAQCVQVPQCIGRHR